MKTNTTTTANQIGTIAASLAAVAAGAMIAAPFMLILVSPFIGGC